MPGVTEVRGRVTASCVELTKVVAIEEPLKLTVAPDRKPVPVIVTEGEVFSGAVEGFREEIVGVTRGAVTVKVAAEEVPLGEGSETVSGYAAGVTEVRGKVTVSCVELVKVVA